MNTSLSVPQNHPDQTMSSREIAMLCNKEHRNVKRDVEKTLSEAKINALKFEHIYFDSRNREQKVYHLPRRECDLVISGYSVPYRLRIIDRWHELEGQPALMSDEEIVQQAMNIQSARIHVLQQEKQDLVTQVEQIKPKAKALDRIASTTGNICITDAAKVLQTKPKTLFGWMSAHKWIYKRIGSGWIGFQCRIDQGVLQHKVVTIYSGGEQKVREQVLITPKGLARLAEAFELEVAA